MGQEFGKNVRYLCWLAARNVERLSNHKRGIPCHLPSLPQSLSLSSFCGVCVLGGDASAWSPFPEEHGHLHTPLCDLEKRDAQMSCNKMVEKKSYVL